MMMPLMYLIMDPDRRKNARSYVETKFGALAEEIHPSAADQPSPPDGLPRIVRIAPLERDVSGLFSCGSSCESNKLRRSKSCGDLPPLEVPFTITTVKCASSREMHGAGERKQPQAPPSPQVPRRSSRSVGKSSSSKTILEHRREEIFVEKPETLRLSTLFRDQASQKENIPMRSPTNLKGLVEAELEILRSPRLLSSGKGVETREPQHKGSSPDTVNPDSRKGPSQDHDLERPETLRSSLLFRSDGNDRTPISSPSIHRDAQRSSARRDVTVEPRLDQPLFVQPPMLLDAPRRGSLFRRRSRRHHHREEEPSYPIRRSSSMGAKPRRSFQLVALANERLF